MVHVVTAYLPPLVRLNPGMIDREVVRFLALTSRAWIDLMLSPEAHPAFAGRAPHMIAEAAPDAPPWAYLLDAPDPPTGGEGTAPGGAAPPIAAWVGAPPAARARQWRKVVAHLEALGRLGPGRRGGPRTFTPPGSGAAPAAGGPCADHAGPLHGEPATPDLLLYAPGVPGRPGARDLYPGLPGAAGPLSRPPRRPRRRLDVGAP